MSPAFSRFLAVALLLAVLGGAYKFVVSPLSSQFRSYQETRERSAQLLQRYRRLAATQEELAAQMAELERRQASSGGYITGASDTRTAADLQNRVNKIVRSFGGTIKSTQILPPKDEKEFRRINLRVQMTADIETLQKVLHSLESSRTFLFLTNLDVRGSRRLSRTVGRTSRATRNNSVNRSLQVRFDLYGYARATKS